MTSFIRNAAAAATATEVAVVERILRVIQEYEHQNDNNTNTDDSVINVSELLNDFHSLINERENCAADANANASANATNIETTLPTNIGTKANTCNESSCLYLYRRRETEEQQRHRNSRRNQNENTNENEKHIQSYIDLIHNYIFHSHIYSNSELKFEQTETETETENANEQKNEYESAQSNNNSNVVMNKFVTQINNAPNNDNNNNSLIQYSFGTEMDYWTHAHPYFVASKYTTLKSEFLRNKWYSLHIGEYDFMIKDSCVFLDTNTGKKMICLRAHEWMKVNGKQLLLEGMQISQPHILCLISYTNNTQLQNHYKKNAFRIENASDTKMQKQVRSKNREIAIWSRMIFESIHCFGRRMKKSRPYFHGISTKVLFRRFDLVPFLLPTSTTVSRHVAQRFATENGFILCLGFHNNLSSLYLDVSLMSMYPNESERLLHRTQVTFTNIIEVSTNTEYNSHLKVLKLWERITDGLFISHLNISETEENMILAMITNAITKGNHHNNNNNNNNNNNDDVPEYIQLLFNSCMFAGNTWPMNVIDNNLGLKNTRLLSLLDPSNKNSLLVKCKKFLFREVLTYSWRISGNNYNKYFNHEWIASPQILRIAFEDRYYHKPLFVEFQFGCQSKPINNLFRCLIRLNNKSANIASVNVTYGLYNTEANIDAYASTQLSKSQLIACALHSVFPSSKLEAKPEINLYLLVHIREVYDISNRRIY